MNATQRERYKWAYLADSKLKMKRLGVGITCRLRTFESVVGNGVCPGGIMYCIMFFQTYSCRARRGNKCDREVDQRKHLPQILSFSALLLAGIPLLCE